MPSARTISLDRMVRAVEKVRTRLLRVAKALDAAGLQYAVVGGNAVAAWVSTVDESAVRNTRDVDVLLRRSDLQPAKTALEAEGFTYRQVAGIDMFLDGPGATVRDAVHVVFAGEKVREHEAMPNPDVENSEPSGQFQVISLDALVQIKLTAFRDKDRTHLRDLIGVGLIDESWYPKLPASLADRLRTLIEDPDG